MKQSKIRHRLITALKNTPSIIAAKAYGSWAYGENAVDVDVAVLVPDYEGVVNKSVYSELRILRLALSEELRIDLDLIPHTMDEIDSKISPIWYPRYNPSLNFGEPLKGDFPIEVSSLAETRFDFSDLTAYVLHDNRTICRRQLLRSLKDESGRIFARKLLHGPGNALTYHSCKHRREYLCSPSNLSKSFELFDEIYGVDSLPAMNFLLNCKKGINFDDAVKLMSWYESLISMVLAQGQRTLYQHVCLELGVK